MTVTRRYRRVPRTAYTYDFGDHPHTAYKHIPLSLKETGHTDVHPRIPTHGAIYKLCLYSDIQDLLDALQGEMQ